MRTNRVSAEETAGIWAGWQAGVSVRGDRAGGGAAVGDGVYGAADGGGIRPRPRRRAARRAELAEREEIACGVAAGASLRAVSRRLGRAPSTISRELRRHGGRARIGPVARRPPRGRRPGGRSRVAWRSSRGCGRLVARRLAQRWSPEQIAGWLRQTYADSGHARLARDDLPHALRAEPRRAAGGAPRASAPRRAFRRPRRPPARTAAARSSMRSRFARDRPRSTIAPCPGHWEGDLLAGTVRSYIGTLVERQSRYVLLVKRAEQGHASRRAGLGPHRPSLPRGLMRTLTWDRGTELAAHARFTVATDVRVYFCDPQSPWQRGSNENTNGLLRQYFPRGMDLSQVSQAQLNAVARELNTRPRKTLGYRTPAAVLASIVATTG